MIGIYAFFWKGIKEFFASKEAVFWTFLFPVIFGVLFAAVFGQEGHFSAIPVGIVPEQYNNTTMCDIFVEGMENMSVDGDKIFEIKNFSSEDEAVKYLKNGSIRSVIIFDGNFTENITSGLGEAKIKIIFDKRDPQEYQMVSSIIASYIDVFEDKVREVRINLTMGYIDEWGNLTNETKEYVELWMKSFANPINETTEIYERESSARITRLWYETAAIGITFVFSGMITSASMISREIEKGTARRLLSTRTKPIEMLIGNLLTVLVIMIISAFIIMLSFFVIFGEFMYIDAAVLAMLVLASLSTTSLGLLLSGISRTQRAATGAANAIAWPISFITGIFLPQFLLPEWMRVIGDYFPASALLRGIRKIVIYGEGIENYTFQMIFATVLTLIFLVAGATLFRWRMKRE